MKKCSIDDCSNKHHGKGFCSKHYNKFELKQNLKKCQVLECDNIIGKYGAKGYCVKHYSRLKRQGTINDGRLRIEKDSLLLRLQNCNDILNLEIDNLSVLSDLSRLYYNDKCMECGWNKGKCDAHHIVSRKKGGLNVLQNMVILCPNCHSLKHRTKKTRLTNEVINLFEQGFKNQRF